ncbi:beta family protein [Vibrio europaeus]|uniref:beta family protein n=1 Tax=Vibrio europaeus TaxID=300876 RepID=UPI00233EBC21|nr:protein beta [Vibrio europaeus]MDC5869873.1 beta family protein [Vibrio europaeus]
MKRKFTSFSYVPILALSPSEMSALEEFPSYHKSNLLPMIPLRGWMAAHTLEKAMNRVALAVGESNIWIADVDPNFTTGKKDRITGKYPRQVFTEIDDLLDSSNGYENWYSFLQKYKNAIPTLQLGNLDQLDLQMERLLSLQRGLVVKINVKKISEELFTSLLVKLRDRQPKNLLIIFDHLDITRQDVLEYEKQALTINRFNQLLPDATFCISSSSFPSSFSGAYRGELPIYERQLFNKISKACKTARVIYSDRGSARAAKVKGGGGLPPPRIDYPQKNEWRFIRKEFADPDDIKDGEKEELYKAAALELKKTDYWMPELRIWGTQMIEKTARGDSHGITNAGRATAVRINLHLFNQLHYLEKVEEVDTEEEWVE